jgi:hypothetical protein
LKIEIDLDIAEPGKGKFTQWSKRGEPNEPGMPKDARAKGAYRHILKTEIAKAINPDWMWSYKAGLVSRSTGGPVIPDSNPQDPEAISKALFGGKASAADLDNINAILAKFKHTNTLNEIRYLQNKGIHMSALRIYGSHCSAQVIEINSEEKRFSFKVNNWVFMTEIKEKQRRERENRFHTKKNKRKNQL